MRATLAAIVCALALVLAPVRPAMAQYDPGWFSAYVVPFLVILEGAVIAIIENLSTVMTQVSIAGASAQHTLQQEKILSTVVEVAKGKEVAAAQAQLQQDAARIREATKLPPMACQTLDAVKTEAVAIEGAKLAGDEVHGLMENHVLGTTNSAATMSQLYSSMDKLKKDAKPSGHALLTPKTYSAAQDEAAQILMKTVIDPQPFEALPSAWMNTPQGRAYELQRMLYQQRLTAASYGLENAYAARKPVPESIAAKAAKKG